MICLYAADGKQVSSILVDRCCSTNSGINLAANIMMAADTTKTATSLLRLRLSGILVCLPMKPLSSLLAVVLPIPCATSCRQWPSACWRLASGSWAVSGWLGQRYPWSLGRFVP